MRCLTWCPNDLTPVYFSVSPCALFLPTNCLHIVLGIHWALPVPEGLSHAAPLPARLLQCPLQWAPADSLHMSVKRHLPKPHSPQWPTLFSGAPPFGFLLCTPRSLHLFCKWVCLWIFCRSIPPDITLQKVGAVAVWFPIASHFPAQCWDAEVPPNVCGIDVTGHSKELAV